MPIPAKVAQLSMLKDIVSVNDFLIFHKKTRFHKETELTYNYGNNFLA